MATEAMRAMDTSTSALMSKAVTRPMTASRRMGTPHRRMAAQAGWMGNRAGSIRLTARASPDRSRKTTSLFTPPQDDRDSRNRIMVRLLYTYGGICFDEGIIPPWVSPVKGADRQNPSAGCAGGGMPLSG